MGPNTGPTLAKEAAAVTTIRSRPVDGTSVEALAAPLAQPLCSTSLAAQTRRVAAGGDVESSRQLVSAISVNSTGSSANVAKTTAAIRCTLPSISAKTLRQSASLLRHPHSSGSHEP